MTHPFTTTYNSHIQYYTWHILSVLLLVPLLDDIRRCTTLNIFNTTYDTLFQYYTLVTHLLNTAHDTHASNTTHNTPALYNLWHALSKLLIIHLLHDMTTIRFLAKSHGHHQSHIHHQIYWCAGIARIRNGKTGENKHTLSIPTHPIDTKPPNHPTKSIHPLTHSNTLYSPQHHQLLLRINHPSIIRILGAGTIPRPFLILEKLKDISALLDLQADGDIRPSALIRKRPFTYR